MAKKRKLSREEERRRRRKAIRRKRRESGWSSDRDQVGFKLETEGVDPELLADIRNIAGEGGLVAPEVLQQMARISDQLADEPEMRDVMAEPGLALAALISQLDADDLRRGEDIDLGDDTWHEALDTVARILFERDDFVQEVMAALSQMHRRFRRHGMRLRAGQTALVKVLIQSADPRSRLGIGLVRALTARSVSAGMALVQMNETISDALVAAGAYSGDIESIRAAIEQSREPLGALLDKHPELYDYLDKQTSEIREEGMSAMLRQELQLNLFSDEELALSAQIFQRHLGTEENGEVYAIKDMEAFLEELNPHTERYMESERLQALREDLKVRLDAGPDGEWFPFLNLVHGDLENALEDPQDPLAFGFVRWALLAETMPYYAENVHEEEE